MIGNTIAAPSRTEGLQWVIEPPVPIMKTSLVFAAMLAGALALCGCASVPPGAAAGGVSPTPVYTQPNHYDAPRGYWKG